MDAAAVLCWAAIWTGTAKTERQSGGSRCDNCMLTVFPGKTPAPQDLGRGLELLRKKAADLEAKAARIRQSLKELEGKCSVCWMSGHDQAHHGNKPCPRLEKLTPQVSYHDFRRKIEYENYACC